MGVRVNRGFAYGTTNRFFKFSGILLTIYLLIALLSSTRGEPSWHRAARRVRTLLTSFVSTSQTTRREIRQAISALSSHHSQSGLPRQALQHGDSGSQNGFLVVLQLQSDVQVPVSARIVAEAMPASQPSYAGSQWPQPPQPPWQNTQQWHRGDQRQRSRRHRTPSPRAWAREGARQRWGWQAFNSCHCIGVMGGARVEHSHFHSDGQPRARVQSLCPHSVAEYTRFKELSRL